eukprot:4014025-Alexandrium_andersonii.AAC.1
MCIRDRYKCNIALGGGRVCGAAFSSVQQLKAHPVHSTAAGHGVRQFIRLVVRGDKCPSCLAVFRSRYSAQ